MKISEVIGNTQQVQVVKPQAVAQQQRVAQVVKQRVAGDAQQEPTEMDKVLGIMQHAELKKQADKNYATNLRQQLAGAEAQLDKGAAISSAPSSAVNTNGVARRR